MTEATDWQVRLRDGVAAKQRHNALMAEFRARNRRGRAYAKPRLHENKLSRTTRGTDSKEDR